MLTGRLEEAWVNRCLDVSTLRTSSPKNYLSHPIRTEKNHFRRQTYHRAKQGELKIITTLVLAAPLMSRNAHINVNGRFDEICQTK